MTPKLFVGIVKALLWDYDSLLDVERTMGMGGGHIIKITLKGLMKPILLRCPRARIEIKVTEGGGLGKAGNFAIQLAEEDLLYSVIIQLLRLQGLLKAVQLGALQNAQMSKAFKFTSGGDRNHSIYHPSEIPIPLTLADQTVTGFEKKHNGPHYLLTDFVKQKEVYTGAYIVELPTVFVNKSHCTYKEHLKQLKLGNYSPQLLINGL